MRKVSKLVKFNPQSEHLYDLIRSPIITEKSTLGATENRYSFKIYPTATKNQVKLAIENLFKVKVKSVNTLNQVGKEKKFRNIKGYRIGYKKAVVRLIEGNTIDVGVKL